MISMVFHAPIMASQRESNMLKIIYNPHSFAYNDAVVAFFPNTLQLVK